MNLLETKKACFNAFIFLRNATKRGIFAGCNPSELCKNVHIIVAHVSYCLRRGDLVNVENMFNEPSKSCSRDMHGQKFSLLNLILIKNLIFKLI